MKTTLLAAIFVACAAAQPPNVIRVVRNRSVQPYADGKAAVNVVGMSAISGLPETWLIELHYSFGSLEDLDKTLSVVSPARMPGEGQAPLPDDVLVPSKTLIALYRPALSYRPDDAFRMFAKMRYCDIVVWRIRPGMEADFAKLLQVRAFSLDSVNLDRPEIGYRVISGAPSGTYIFLSPLTSFRVLDDGRVDTPAYAEGAAASARKAAADIEIVREHLWFRIEPRMSYVSEAFASSDPAFWLPPAK